jgi:hypothetical protein
MKRLLIVLFVLLSHISLVFSQVNDNTSLRTPTLYLDLRPYIQEETNKWLSTLNVQNKYHLYMSEYFGSYFPKNTDGKIDWENGWLVWNAYMSSKISINTNIAVPVYIAYMFPDMIHTETYANSSVVFGTGLLYTGKFGTIAGLIGIDYFKIMLRLMQDAETRDNIWDDVVIFNILPSINAAEFPVIGLALKTIESYFGFNDTGIENYSFNFISQPVEIRSFRIASIDVFHNSYRYNPESEIKNYGLRMDTFFLNLGNAGEFGLGIDTGYRDYFNISGNSLNYDDTPFVKLSLLRSDGNSIFSYYALFERKYYPLPKFGGEFNINYDFIKWVGFMELGFPKDAFEFSIGLRLLLNI